MPRSNRRRRDDHEPLDVEKVTELVQRERPESDAERDDRLNREWGRRRHRQERRDDERTANLIDWSKCCIPGCSQKLTWSDQYDISPRVVRSTDPSQRLPICGRHLIIIHKQAIPHWYDPDVEEARKQYARRTVIDEVARDERLDRLDQNDGHDGHIYFVRQNHLIKVGWSSRLRRRLKQYGADAQVLCHFPATRTDETHLHRQLRPYLAMGREWYRDCDLIRDVIAGYVSQYGPPTIYPDWTAPKAPPVRRRRSA